MEILDRNIALWVDFLKNKITQFDQNLDLSHFQKWLMWIAFQINQTNSGFLHAKRALKRRFEPMVMPSGESLKLVCLPSNPEFQISRTSFCVVLSLQKWTTFPQIGPRPPNQILRFTLGRSDTPRNPVTVRTQRSNHCALWDKAVRTDDQTSSIKWLCTTHRWWLGVRSIDED